MGTGFPHQSAMPPAMPCQPAMTCGHAMPPVHVRSKPRSLKKLQTE